MDRLIWYLFSCLRQLFLVCKHWCCVNETLVVIMETIIIIIVIISQHTHALTDTDTHFIFCCLIWKLVGFPTHSSTKRDASVAADFRTPRRSQRVCMCVYTYIQCTYLNTHTRSGALWHLRSGIQLFGPNVFKQNITLLCVTMVWNPPKKSFLEKCHGRWPH